MSMHYAETATPVTVRHPRLSGASSQPFGTLCVNEPLDLETSTRFLERARTLSRDCRCLVVDLSLAAFVDSMGVRSLLFLAAELEREGKELRLVIGAGSRVQRTLGLLRLLERFHASGTLHEAVAS